ncbi:hypothetical protein Tco_1503272 [Tanacetum coccineum]
MSEHETYSLGESSSGQAMKQEPNSSDSVTKEQLDKFDAWMEDVGADDDEVPDDKVLQELKERLTLPTPKKKASVVHNYQRGLKSPPMTLLNQDLFYLKHDNSGPKKYILSLHKYSVVPFPDDDIEEQTSRWAKQDHIRRQK